MVVARVWEEGEWGAGVNGCGVPLGEDESDL